MFSHRIKATVIAFLCISVFLVATAPQSSIVPEPTKTVKFVVAAWDYPDEYGQGIAVYIPEENSTGVFLNINTTYPSHPTIHTLNYTPNTALRFDMRPVVNFTLLGLTYPDDFDTGRNHIRLNITVRQLSAIVFFQANLTYGDDGSQILGTDTVWYSMVAVVNVILEMGATYNVRVTYEIFY